MEVYRRRNHAAWVAYFDAVFTIIWIANTAFLIISLGEVRDKLKMGSTIVQISRDQGLHRDVVWKSIERFVEVVTYALYTCAAVSLFTLFATWCLSQSVQIVIVPTRRADAMLKARLWCLVNFVLMIILCWFYKRVLISYSSALVTDIIPDFIQYLVSIWKVAIIVFSLRPVFLFIVWQYIRGVETAVPGQLI